MNGIKYSVAILFVFVFWFAKAQDLGFNHNKITLESNRLHAKIMGKVFHLDAVTNSHFLYPDDWFEGTVVFSNGDKYENLRMRLHIKIDELVVYSEQHSLLYLVEKEQVKSFSMEVDGVTRQMVKLNRNGEGSSGQYFEQLYSGAQSLLSFQYIYEQKVNPYTDEMGIMRDVEYRLRTNYYRYSAKDGLAKIALKRRAFYSDFPEQKKEMKKIFRKNKLMLENEQGLIKAFQVLDEQGIFD